MEGGVKGAVVYTLYTVSPVPRAVEGAGIECRHMAADHRFIGKWALSRVSLVPFGASRLDPLLLVCALEGQGRLGEPSVKK